MQKSFFHNNLKEVYKKRDFNYFGSSFCFADDYAMPEMKWCMCETFIPVIRDGYSLTGASFSGKRTKLKHLRRRHTLLTVFKE